MLRVRMAPDEGIVAQPRTAVVEPRGPQPRTEGPQYGKREGWVPPENDHTAVGSRREFTARVRALVSVAGDQALEALAAPEVVADYVAAIHAGVKARDRTALHIYAKQMKMIDQDRTITVEFINSLGARSERELRAYVEAAKSVEGAGPHDGAARCTDWLEAYLDLYPDQRATIVKRLGGLVAAG